MSVYTRIYAYTYACLYMSVYAHAFTADVKPLLRSAMKTPKQEAKNHVSFANKIDLGVYECVCMCVCVCVCVCVCAIRVSEAQAVDTHTTPYVLHIYHRAHTYEYPHFITYTGSPVFAGGSSDSSDDDHDEDLEIGG
jgi:hypothetical protein